MSEDKTLLAIANELENNMKCNCDLDNWEPESSTGHSWVCRPHRSGCVPPPRASLSFSPFPVDTGDPSFRTACSFCG